MVIYVLIILLLFRCTKLKIFRPKTCAHHPKKEVIDDRPSTASMSSFERKWRFIRQNKVTPIDLAICWDLCPENPEDEPKPPTHIDGSNGSQAPAVFSLVHTPKDSLKDTPKCDGVHNCGPIFGQGARSNQDFILDRPKTSNQKRERAKSAQDLQAITQQERKSHHHKSSPNLNEPCVQHSCKKLGGRLCVACELKKAPKDNGNQNKCLEDKQTSGVPQQKYVSRMPKIKRPYRPLKYWIDSLAPPFSFQKHRGRDDYPEHWRLTTVYQHSYKPIQFRKRSLLQTVYK